MNFIKGDVPNFTNGTMREEWRQVVFKQCILTSISNYTTENYLTLESIQSLFGCNMLIFGECYGELVLTQSSICYFSGISLS